MLQNGKPAFATSALSNHHKRTMNIIEALNQQIITEGEGIKKTTLLSSKVHGLSVNLDKYVVPSFNYPIFLSEERGVAIDDRPYRNIHDQITRTDSVSDLAIGASLEYFWNTDIGRFQSISDITSAAFSFVISACFKRRLNSDMREQSFIRAYFGFYYYLLFKSEVEFSEMSDDDIEYIFYTTAVSTLRLPRETADDLWQTAGVEKVVNFIKESRDSSSPGMGLLDVFCENLPEVLNTPAIRTFDRRTLAEMVVNIAWAGADKVNHSMVMLEHPPMLIAMITIVIKRKSFWQKTLVGQTALTLKSYRMTADTVANMAVGALTDINEM